jgi:hypothetical protein
VKIIEHHREIIQKPMDGLECHFNLIKISLTFFQNYNHFKKSVKYRSKIKQISKQKTIRFSLESQKSDFAVIKFS